jgi:hypothetical protein
MPDKGRRDDSVGNLSRLGPEDSSGGWADFLDLNNNGVSPYRDRQKFGKHLSPQLHFTRTEGNHSVYPVHKDIICHPPVI